LRFCSNKSNVDAIFHVFRKYFKDYNDLPTYIHKSIDMVNNENFIAKTHWHKVISHAALVAWFMCTYHSSHWSSSNFEIFHRRVIHLRVISKHADAPSFYKHVSNTNYDLYYTLFAQLIISEHNPLVDSVYLNLKDDLDRFMLELPQNKFLSADEELRLIGTSFLDCDAENDSQAQKGLTTLLETLESDCGTENFQPQSALEHVTTKSNSVCLTVFDRLFSEGGYLEFVTKYFRTVSLKDTFTQPFWGFPSLSTFYPSSYKFSPQSGCEQNGDDFREPESNDAKLAPSSAAVDEPAVTSDGATYQQQPNQDNVRELNTQFFKPVFSITNNTPNKANQGSVKVKDNGPSIFRMS